ncbi:GGDEF domain-containing protein [Mariprofundus ferrooxydans]|uniref:GGDEF domain-containing protein n=1 Tax=Mariprofundus ferrooxydans TaxID=314344 RepID=UPI00036B3134|nr:GGDEF domain-containing protein [Mariprofundus ferrooxydans]
MLAVSFISGVVAFTLCMHQWSQITIATITLMVIILAQGFWLNRIVVLPIRMLQRLARQNVAEDPLSEALLSARGDEIGSLRLTMLASEQELLLQQKAMQELTTKMDEDRRHDPLTRLHNRRHLYLEGPAQFAMAHRLNYPVSVMMIDLDFFKKINDTHGHAAGDRVLVKVSLALTGHCRVYDILIRFGGEEFTLVMLNCNQEQSMQIAQRIREDIAGLKVEFNQKMIPVTCSIGVCSALHTEMETMIHLADQAVYQAKSDGRNCVRHANHQ